MRSIARGNAFIGNEIPVTLVLDATKSVHIVNFVYQVLCDADGAASGIFVHGVDVTDLVRGREGSSRPPSGSVDSHLTQQNWDRGTSI